ncbi:MAG: hypothetical protein O3C05_02500 [Proteobacteria bacterium]|nr:hypothetical protein [Pseudomonadota bacterium]
MLRLLPYVMVCLIGLLGYRLLDVVDKDMLDFSNWSLGSQDNSEDISKSNQVPDKVNVDNKKGSGSEVISSAQLDNKSNEIAQRKSSQINEESVRDFSPTEIELLQHLRNRRLLLEKRESNMRLQQDSLDIVKSQIDGKIERFEKLKYDIKSSIDEYKRQENVKNSRLVKIYESMKPKDAAKIFEDMQWDVLLDVIEKMKEAKIAPILAAMDTEKAKNITIGLAMRGRVVSLHQ